MSTWIDSILNDLSVHEILFEYIHPELECIKKTDVDEIFHSRLLLTSVSAALEHRHQWTAVVIARSRRVDWCICTADCVDGDRAPL